MHATLIDSMGSDLSVANAARVSMGKRSDEFSAKDASLIRYLARHAHWTPFGHCQATFHVKAPIFVARQLGRHTVGLVWNEVSRRYVDDEPEFYWPKEWRGRPEGSIKQGSAGVVHLYDDWPKSFAAETLALYNVLLRKGVAPEQARMILPQNTYTEFYWTGSLAAWARVCKLRLDAHTQSETREVAQQISDHMAAAFPVSWAALMEHAK